MPKKSVSLFAFCSATLLCGLSAFGQGPDYQIVGVNVTAPKNQVVAQDEAVNIKGNLRVTGVVPANPMVVSGVVDVGYYLREAIFDPFTEQTTYVDRFVIVRHLTATGTPSQGTHGGRGEALPFDIWCNAPPPWHDDRIYFCKGDPRDDGDGIGAFAVGLSPADRVPWWLAWLFN